MNVRIQLRPQVLDFNFVGIFGRGLMGSDHIVLFFFNLNNRSGFSFTLGSAPFYITACRAQGFQLLHTITRACLLGLLFYFLPALTINMGVKWSQ